MSIISGLSGLVGLDAEINRGAQRSGPMPSPELRYAGMFDDVLPRDGAGRDQSPRPALNIGGLAARDIINLAINNRALGVLRVMHVMPNAVKPISIHITNEKSCSDVWLELYAAMSDGTSTAASKFNFKIAHLKDDQGCRITIAASTNDEDVFRDCILGLGLQKIEETTIYCHESVEAMAKLCSWQTEAVTNDEFRDLTKAMHLMVEMQTFKDDANAGSFDVILGDAIISLPVRPSSVGGSVFDVLIKTATKAAKDIGGPAVRKLIQQRIQSFER